MQSFLDKLVQYFRPNGPVVLLESQSENHPASRKSYLAACPEATIKAWDNRIEITENGQKSSFEANPWDALQECRKKWDDWLLGYLGYDLKNHVEVLHSGNPDEIEAADLFFMRPKILIQVDHQTATVEVIKGKLPGEMQSVSSDLPVKIKNLHSTVTKQQYLEHIKTAQQEIFDGSYYEINLSHQLKANFRDSPFALYRQMRAKGPVPFGAFIQDDEYAVCCMSPERFLKKEGAMVFSQPIKGTIKRNADAVKDQQLKKQLVDSAKDQAENLMIVDLVRNDLSRIAKSGSVKVENLFEIQTFGTVHQMVSTIRAEAEIGNPVEILKACYPMGSMTGAPKISAMRAIDRLEKYRRGIYSGAIGYLSPKGDFDFNVVIRTAIIKNEQLFYAVGGAITADSDALSEWSETWLKAKALLDAVEETKEAVKK